MQLKLQLIKKLDIPNVASVYARAFNQSYPEDRWNVATAKNRVHYWYKKSPRLFFVATLDNKTVGGVVGEVMDYRDSPYLMNVELFVDPHYQSRKIGKKLLAEIVLKAKKKSQIQGVSLLASNKKSFPMEWYQKIGFKKSGWIELRARPKELKRLFEQIVNTRTEADERFTKEA